MREGRSSKSEYMFLELALRALKANGLACVIAPYNYYDKLPKKLRAWVDDRVMDFADLGELPGEFRFTGIRVHGWMIYRNSYDTWEKHFEEVMSVHPEPVQAAAPFTTSIIPATQRMIFALMLLYHFILCTVYTDRPWWKEERAASGHPYNLSK